MDRADLEKLKADIDKLNDIQHNEIYKIITSHAVKHTRAKRVAHIDMFDISDSVIKEIKQYLAFCDTLPKSDFHANPAQ
jgi:hypothetical protein